MKLNSLPTYSVNRFSALSGQVRQSEKFGVSTRSYTIAKNFLALDTFIEQKYLKTLLHSKNGFLKSTGNILNTVSQALFKYDFQKRIPFFNMGKIAIEPPKGAFGSILYLGIIPSRLYAASLRPNVDKGEYIDILIRDLVGITAFVFMLGPLRNYFAKYLGKSTGLNLLNSENRALGYSELVNMYRINHPNRLIYIASDRRNYRGMMSAMKQLNEHTVVQQLKKMSPDFKQRYSEMRDFMLQFIDEMTKRGYSKNQFHQATKDPEIRTLANKGYKMMMALERDLQREIYSPVANIGKLGLKFSKLYQAPSVSRVFAQFACGKRVWVDVLGFALTIAFMGYGLTAFNEWYTNYRRGNQKIKEN